MLKKHRIKESPKNFAELGVRQPPPNVWRKKLGQAVFRMKKSPNPTREGRFRT